MGLKQVKITTSNYEISKEKTLEIDRNYPETQDETRNEKTHFRDRDETENSVK